MITLHYQNILREKLSFRHGISKRAFHRLLKKHQPLVDVVFSKKNEFGYAFLGLSTDQKLVTRINKFARSQSGKWDDLVVLGIGGSALGLIAIKEALIGMASRGPNLHVIDNIDPDYVDQITGQLNLKKTLFIVISKSGGTVEPMSLYSFFRQKLIQSKVKKISNHFVFVTDKKQGILRELADKEGVKTFEVPDKVGGRFSVLSSVGLLPAALAGVKIQSLLKGAHDMRGLIKKKKYSENPALLLAVVQYWQDVKKNKNMTVLMPYSNLLFRVGDWYRQLLAESLGKSEKVGPTPINALGTTDQHSQLQLYNQGPNNKWFIFMNVENHKKKLKLSKHLPDPIAFLNSKTLSDIIKAAYLGTSDSLAKNNRPNLTLNIDSVSEESIGGLFMLFEFQVALLGLMYKVNAFDQPGVEDSKILTKQILQS